MSRRFIYLPGWAILSLGISGLFVVSALLLHRDSLTASSQVSASTVQSGSQTDYEPGQRRQLTYEQWVALLGQEAKVAAEAHPKRLTILAGDSLSLWFPAELLPGDETWLNQGISGETSFGLLKRLKLFDQTHPDAIFVMIGINDLIRGVSAETLLANHREIIRHLKAVHPKAQIVVESILPHAGRQLLTQPSALPTNESSRQGNAPSPWVPRLKQVSNDYIRELNQSIASMAVEEGVEYLDLHSYFTDRNGDLAADLSTDGLHLSLKGYQVWRSRLQVFAQQPPQRVRRSP